MGSKNHHFLSQFYLRGFCSSRTRKKGQKVWFICKTASADCSEELVKDVGFEEDFHTVTKSDGTLDSDSIEDQLAKLETLYAPVRTKLLKGDILDVRERHHLSEFVCLMKMRTPAQKAAVGQQRSKIADAMMRSLALGDRLEALISDLPKVKHWPSSARMELARRMRKGILDRRIEFTNSNASLLHPMFATAFDARLIRIFDKMNLELLSAPVACAFITADQPVILFDPTPPHPLKPTGLTCPAVEVTFPLSAKMLLRFSWGHSSEQRVITAGEIDEFNRRTVVMARRFLFASRREESILKLIRENYARHAGTDLATMPITDGKTFMLSRTIPVRPQEYYAAVSARS